MGRERGCESRQSGRWWGRRIEAFVRVDGVVVTGTRGWVGNGGGGKAEMEENEEGLSMAWVSLCLLAFLPAELFV